MAGVNQVPTVGAFGSSFRYPLALPGRRLQPGPARRPWTNRRRSLTLPGGVCPWKCYMLNGYWSQSPIRGTRDNRRRRKDGSARVRRGALPRTTSSATAPPSRRGTRSGDRTRRVVPNATACALELPRTEASAQVELIGILRAFFNRTRDWSDLEEMRKAGRLDFEAVREILVASLGESDERVRALDRLAETGRAFRP